MKEVSLKNQKLIPERLLPFGFSEEKGRYLYSAPCMDGLMRFTAAIEQDGTVCTQMTDTGSGEEYVLHRVPGAQGAFVGQVRDEHDRILGEILSACFEPDIFQSDQAREIIAYVRETYQNELEYLWKRFPNNAVVRRSDTQTWYAAVLTVSRRKLGLDSDEIAEILDLRGRPEEITALVDGKTYFPGYHMNKKNWYTICLDGSVSTEELYKRIDASYILAKK